MMRRPSLSLAAAETLLDRVMPGSHGLTPITSGMQSLAYRFQYAGARYILRLNRSSDGFAKDAFVHRRFAQPGFVIPAVFSIGAADDGLFYCLSAELPGITLQDLPANDLAQVLAPVAAIMRKIAASELHLTAGYGPFDRNGIAPHASWRTFLLSCTDPVAYGRQIARRHFGPAFLDRLTRRIEQLSSHCPEERRLVHGDFGSNNVLAADGCITGVLDWSEALFGDPLYDVANIYFWRTWLDCMEQQARYFEHAVEPAPSQAERLLCYQLRIGFEQIFASLAAGSLQSASWAAARCSELLG
jgi:hygromycin-B 4-O-kinase